MINTDSYLGSDVGDCIIFEIQPKHSKLIIELLVKTRWQLESHGKFQLWRIAGS
jgi:hypothetical protein